MEYKCYCSRERVERALISLGADELKSILRRAGLLPDDLPVLRRGV